MAVRGVAILLVYFTVSSVCGFSIIARPFSRKQTNGLFNNMFLNLQHIFENLPLKSQVSETSGARVDGLGEPQNVFESNKIIPLQNGGEKIEKLIEKEYFDVTGLSKRDVSKELTELYRFPNQTLRMVTHYGTNMTKTKERKIDCIDNEDCNRTSFCLKETYKCEFCHGINKPCTQSFQCCSGTICDTMENVCRTNDKIARKCSNTSDCSEEQCCTLNEDGEGVCQPYLKEGEDCSVDPFEQLFEFNNRRNSFKSNLPNQCLCAPTLSCKKEMSFVIFQSETCEKLQNTEHSESAKFPRNGWRFHDDEDRLSSLPIPDFSDIHSLIGNIFKRNIDTDDNVVTTTTTTKPPKRRLVNNEQKELEQKLSDILNDNEKIRFNPLANSVDSQQQHAVKLPLFHNSRDSNKANDSDDEDIAGYNADKNDLLDILNDDNDDSDDDDIDDNDVIEKNNDVMHKDRKQMLTDRISMKARQATHKIVDGIFDNIVNAIQLVKKEN